MGMPKKRLTSTRSGNRQSHLAIKGVSLAKCEKCHESIMPHAVCPNCGTYRGRQVIEVDKKHNHSEHTHAENEG